MAETGWRRAFDDPIPVPGGKRLAVETLINCAEGRDFLMHARIGMLRALNAGKPNPNVTPREKKAKAYRIVR